MSEDAAGPIAVFDSGIGGLSVLRHLQAQLPRESFIYLADQANVPYGARSATQIYEYSYGITRFLLAQRAKMIIVACNTASAAALARLRHAFPAIPFVGMEPAVKPAARETRSGKVGVLATAGTISSERYAALTARFAQGIQVIPDPCRGLVAQIEAGALDTAETEQLLRDCLAPMLRAGVDTVVLGCTHYPFVQPLIEHIVGPAVTVIDPAPAVARQAERVLQQRRLMTSAAAPGDLRFITTHQPHHFALLLHRLLGLDAPVEASAWQGNFLVAG